MPVANAGQAKNAAMVEEMTAASHMLATEVDALNRLLGQFELGQGARASLGSLRAARSDRGRGARPPPRQWLVSLGSYPDKALFQNLASPLTARIFLSVVQPKGR